MAVKGIYSLQGRTRVNRSGNYQTITGFYNSSQNPNALCSDIGNTSFTVYTATQTTLANVYANTASIYSNTNLSTLAPSGTYSNFNGGSGKTYFQWNGTAWTGTNTCP